ncbi:hypothetical protein IE81DRAFT_349741 [Ceraceosorus guamensis]|uniref:Uncharacterized protein n=1 Tax=Ceraceosorus guamensis TaxID=1522189 RepID=A0A316VQJ8_9BASI|nr:hypothetical protein IE81DRAFT_349741 [Ceraceosorus guamensis]PWN39919.1 hypothetical protein IE81DRAFT_349741 [Ceraceosorus guamensis]
MVLLRIDRASNTDQNGLNSGTGIPWVHQILIQSQAAQTAPYGAQGAEQLDAATPLVPLAQKIIIIDVASGTCNTISSPLMQECRLPSTEKLVKLAVEEAGTAISKLLAMEAAQFGLATIWGMSLQHQMFTAFHLALRKDIAKVLGITALKAWRWFKVKTFVNPPGAHSSPQAQMPQEAQFIERAQIP